MRLRTVSRLLALAFLLQAAQSAAQSAPEQAAAPAAPTESGNATKPAAAEPAATPATPATPLPMPTEPTPPPPARPLPAASAAAEPEALAEPAAAKQTDPDADKPKKKKLKPPTVFGYLQVHYRRAIAAGADQNVDYDDFRVQRARIGLKGDVYPWLGYDVEIDPRAPQITGVLRDAFIALRFIPRHELRIGQQKTQFGYENRESSSKLYAVNRTEVSDSLSRGGVTLRDIGLGLIGNIKLGSGFRIEDAITVVNGDGMNTQADRTKMKDVWGRLGARYKRDRLGNFVAHLGVSGGIGDYIDEGDAPLDVSDDFRLEFRRIGADLELDQDWFFISSEFVRGHDEDTSTGETTDIDGYYVNVVGKTPWQVGPIVRYDALGDEFKRWTFGLFYGLASEPFRLMVNYEYRQLRDMVRADDKFYIWAQVQF